MRTPVEKDVVVFFLGRFFEPTFFVRTVLVVLDWLMISSGSSKFETIIVPVLTVLVVVLTILITDDCWDGFLMTGVGLFVVDPAGMTGMVSMLFFP